jgi:hypothetical protein
MSKNKRERPVDTRYLEILDRYENLLQQHYADRDIPELPVVTNNYQRDDKDQLKNLLIAALVVIVLMLGAALAFTTHQDNSRQTSTPVSVNVNQHQGESQQANQSALIHRVPCPAPPVNPPTPAPKPKPVPPKPKPVPPKPCKLRMYT